MGFEFDKGTLRDFVYEQIRLAFPAYQYSNESCASHPGGMQLSKEAGLVPDSGADIVKLMVALTRYVNAQV